MNYSLHHSFSIHTFRGRRHMVTTAVVVTRRAASATGIRLVARGGCLRLFIFGKCVLCSVLMCTVSSILARHGPYWTKHVVDGRCEVRRALFYPIWPRKFLVACVAYSRRTHSSEQGESHRSIQDSLWWPRLLRCVVTDSTKGSTCRSRKKKVSLRHMCNSCTMTSSTITYTDGLANVQGGDTSVGYACQDRR